MSSRVHAESVPAAGTRRVLSVSSPQVLARYRQGYANARCAACGRPLTATRQPAGGTDSAWTAATNFGARARNS
jgi:hypothetical protein